MTKLQRELALTYTMEEVAERLHISRRALQDLLAKLGRDNPGVQFYRLAGRRKLFTPSDFKRLLEALPCRSNS